ncbi:MAG TPA: class II aldolase/adducin family protein, partial [Terriglobales bacterium]|nr:class II aldolase/adducin family protein [Terriglobales bacterium]
MASKCKRGGAMGHWKEIMLRGAVIPLQQMAMLREQVAMLRGTSSNEDRMRHELVHFGAMLHENGFVAATDGNLSVRLDDGRIMITPTGFSKGMMEPKDMVVVDLAGKKLSGSHNASSEAQMHLAIYQERRDVNAVVHAHPCTATAFACSGIALEEPICAEVVMTLGKVPLAPYATTGTPELTDNIRPFIRDHSAILLANHGVVTYAEDLLSAYLKMEAVEHFAKVTL